MWFWLVKILLGFTDNYKLILTLSFPILEPMIGLRVQTFYKFLAIFLVLGTHLEYSR